MHPVSSCDQGGALRALHSALVYIYVLTLGACAGGLRYNILGLSVRSEGSDTAGNLVRYCGKSAEIRVRNQKSDRNQKSEIKVFRRAPQFTSVDVRLFQDIWPASRENARACSPAI